MKENVEKNVNFLNRHDALRLEIQPDGLMPTSSTLAQIQARICDEFDIDGHSYRAWKSRLNLQYGGRYKARIAPYLWQPKFKLTKADVDADGNVVESPIEVSVDSNLQAKVEIKIPASVFNAN